MYGFIFPIFSFFFLFLVVTILISSFKGNKVKINDAISDKYKDIAFKLIDGNERLNEERKKYRIKHLLIRTILISFVPLIFFTRYLGHLTFVLILFLIITLIVLIITNKDENSIYGEVIPKIINDYMKGLKYNHYEGINSSIYREARFEGYDRYSSDDLISGTINDQDFIMSEVHTERRHTDSDGNTSYTTIFHGAFAKVTLKKDFKCFVNIVNNKVKLFN